jgi:hypothetical protein
MAGFSISLTAGEKPDPALRKLENIRYINRLCDIFQPAGSGNSGIKMRTAAD